MAARHRSRQRALQVLYQWDMTKRPVDEAIRAFYDTLDADKIAAESMEHDPMEEEDDDEAPSSGRDEFMEELAAALPKWRPTSTIASREKSAHWKLERMPIVDRNILRLGIYEMSRQDTPAAVVIDEALELARQFSGEESVAVHQRRAGRGSQGNQKLVAAQHEHPDGGLRSHALRKNRRTGRCFGALPRGARRTRRTRWPWCCPRIAKIAIRSRRAKLIAACGFRSAPATWSIFSKPRSNRRRHRRHYYFVQCPALYDRDGIYGTAAGDFPDNHVRFAVLSMAAIGVARLSVPARCPAPA